MVPVFISFLNFMVRFCRHDKSGNGIFFIIFVVIVFVFIPCFFKPSSSFAREEIFKVPHGNLVRQKEVSEKFMNGVFSLIDIQQDIIKRMSEFFGSGVKRYDFMNLPFSVLGKKMVGDSSDKNPEKNVKPFFDKIGNLHLTLDPILWLGFAFVCFYWITHICIELFGILYTHICDRYFRGQPLINLHFCPDNVIIAGFSGSFARCRYQQLRGIIIGVLYA
jgi:hypothetical protein